MNNETSAVKDMLPEPEFGKQASISYGLRNNVNKK